MGWEGRRGCERRGERRGESQLKFLKLRNYNRKKKEEPLF
jgi:hypothetical protein